MSAVASAAITTPIVHLPSPALAVPHADAMLVDLGLQFEAASKKYDAVWSRAEDLSGKPGGRVMRARADKLEAQVEEMGRQILKTPATTIEGLKAKAKVARWCCGGNFYLGDEAEMNDLAAFHSLASDLLAMTGFPRNL